MTKHTLIKRNKYAKFIKKLLWFLLALIALSLLTIFLFYRDYKNDSQNEKIKYGVSFSARQAENFNLNPDEVLTALLDDAGFKRFRLMSYWSDIELQKGNYDFSELDNQINEVTKRGGEISLAIGLRQPRWPECFVPEWAKNMTIDEYKDSLYEFIKVTVGRYKSNPAIISWQLENEFHLNVFGKCPDHNRRRLIEEYWLVKNLDQSRPIVMTLSNNYFGFPVNDPRPDIFGVSIYSKVYESRFLNRYVVYPFPSWYYGGRAAITKFLTGRDSFIHELQLEPWGPNSIWEMSTEEQDKSMDAKRISRQLNFAGSTGMRTIDLWGGEWWYWRYKVLNDSQPWNIVKGKINQ